MVTRAPVALLVVAALAVPSLALAQTIDASVDRDTIGLDEVVNLSIVAPASGLRIGAPEGEDFALVGQSTFTEIQILNGRRQQSTTTTLSLRPLRSGNLTIGRVTVQTPTGELHTDPIAITVTPRAAAPSTPPAAQDLQPTRPSRRTEGQSLRGGPATLAPPPQPLSDVLYTGPAPRVPEGEPFIMASVTEASPYVGQQVIVDYVLFTPASAFGIEGIELTEPEFARSWFLDVTELRTGGFSGRLGTRRVGAELYESQVLRSYALVPLEGGELVVPPIGLELAIRGFSRRGGTRTVRSQPLVLDVRTPPTEGRPAGFVPGNVGVFRVVASADTRTVRVGDSVNVTIAVSGSGLMSRVRLPSMPPLDGARVFPPDDSSNADAGSDLWIRGSARRRFAIVPAREGTLTIPALEFAAFDPWTGEYSVLKTEPIEVRVSGVNPTVQAPSVDEPPAAREDDWLAQLPPLREVSPDAEAGAVWFRSPAYVCAVCAPPLAWFGVLVAARVRRRRDETADERRTRNAARSARGAIEKGDADGIARALRDYVEDVSGRPARGLTLAALASRVAELSGAEAGERLAEAVRRAEEARFAGAAEVETLRSDALAALAAVEAER